jgi:hypothetical protein
MDQMKVLTSRLDSVIATRATRAGPDPAAVEHLLVAIAQTIGESYVWTSQELLEHATLPGRDALRDAIAATVGTVRPAKRLGKLMHAMLGVNLNGLRVVRTCRDSEGSHWKVETV